jgi:serine/threonine-protein kinase
MGSPLYMSPEQLTSPKSVDARSDIWALGVIVQELISGEPPFLGSTMPEIIAKIVHVAPTPIAQSRPDTPPELAAVLSRCLAKDPNERFADLAELARALAPFAPRRAAEISLERISRVLSVATPALPESEPRAVVLGAQTVDAWGETHVRVGAKRRPVRAFAGMSVLLVALVGTLALWRSHRAAPSPPASASSDTRVTAVAAEPSSRPDPTTTRAPSISPPAPSSTESDAASAKATPPPLRYDAKPSPAHVPPAPAPTQAPQTNKIDMQLQ